MERETLSVRLLLGAETVPVRRMAIAWAGIGGWLLGSSFYLCFARYEAGTLLFGIPPAVLSAVAVARATRDGRASSAQIIGSSVVASLLCPFVTLTPLLAFDSSSHGGMILVVGGSIGAFFAAPLGALFGVLYAWAWRSIDGARAFDRAGLEVAWMRFGVGFIGLSALLFLADLAFPNPWPLSMVTWERPRPDVLVWLAFGTFLFGLLVSSGGLVRRLRRLRLARRVLKGEVGGWAFVPIASVPGAEALPRLFVRGPADMVLVRRADAACGPFRSQEAVELIART